MTRASDTAKLLGAGATILDGTTISTADNTDQLTLLSTDADANAGPNLRMYRNSGSPADADILGVIEYEGRNDNSQDVRYVQITSQANDVSDGSEDGSYYISTMVGGALSNRMNVTPAEIVFNEESKDVDFRVESNGNANMLFVDGGNDKVGIGNNNPNDFGSLASDLVIGTTSGEHGLTIVTGTGNSARMQFADNTASPFVGAIEYAHASINAMIFYTDGSARMRISSSGTVFYGCTALPDGSADGVSLASTQSQRRFSINATSTSNQILFYNGNGNIGTISTNGSATAYATSSDYRLKENVVTDWDATTRLKQLKPSRFNFIADADTTVDGFLAHEAQAVVPECVTGTKDATEDITNVVLNADGTVLTQDISEADWEEGKLSTTDADGNTVDPIYASDTTWVASKTIPVMQGIDQSKLVPLLVKTIQELEARITALES